MLFQDVYMGTLVSPWMNKKNIKYITFSVTDDCNLMCKYCYFTHKTTKNRMTFDVARKAVDYILSEDKFLIHDGVVWDFIGGEPTLEMDLIDQICDYILYKMYTLNHKWLYCYRFMIGTNGLLYASKKFQDFLTKHNHNLHVNITVDGSKEKHDLSRIKKDGTGSYEDIVKILPLWFKQTGNYSTKSTFAHADLPYLKDSIIHLWELGFKNVMANVVFEDVWTDGDDMIYEEQLCQLADYIIDNQIWNKVSVRFFSSNIGFPVGDQQRRANFCGSGNMLAIDYQGKFFPCVRFMDSALNEKHGRIIGNSDTGIIWDRIRAFNTLSYDVQSPEKCLNCEISSGCTWCTGFNYDQSNTDTIFERQTFNCKMHHANVRANRYFWKLYEEKTGFVSPLRYNTYTAKSRLNNYLYIYRNDLISTCPVQYSSKNNDCLSDENYLAAIRFCENNNLIPIHVGFETQKNFGYYIGYPQASYTRDDFTIDIVTHDLLQKYSLTDLSKTLIYTVSYNELNYIYADIIKITNAKSAEKISLVVTDYYRWNKEQLYDYEKILKMIIHTIFKLWSGGYYVQIDVITDNLFMSEKQFCSAGLHQWTMAPNGMIYSCIGEYFVGQEPITAIDDISDYRDLLCSYKNLQVCDYCNVKHCNKCYLLNYQLTCESSVPFEIHCIKANMELSASIDLLQMLDNQSVNVPFDMYRKLQKPQILDPLVELCGDNTFANQGYYKISQ